MARPSQPSLFFRMRLMMTRLLHKKREAVLMLGLKNSGKTTILYKLQTGEMIFPSPTFGFNMEILQFNDIELDVMDVGGGDKIVPLWKHYLIAAAAIVFVLDWQDERIDKSRDLLADILSRPERKGIPLLVIVNKAENIFQEITSDDLQRRLDLTNHTSGRKSTVQLVSAETGVGLSEAFTWLCAALGSDHASRKLKRNRNKKGKNGRKVWAKKKIHKTDNLNKRCQHTEDFVGDTSSRKPNVTLCGGQPCSLISVEEREFVYPVVHNKINSFFKDRVGSTERPAGPFSRGNSRVEVKPLSDESLVVDTLSTNPHNPQYERRSGSMQRLTEIKEKNDATFAKTSKDCTEPDHCQQNGGWEKIRRLFIRRNVASGQHLESKVETCINGNEEIRVVQNRSSIASSEATNMQDDLGLTCSKQLAFKSFPLNSDTQEKKPKKILRKRIKSSDALTDDKTSRIKASAINRIRNPLTNTKDDDHLAELPTISAEKFKKLIQPKLAQKNTEATIQEIAAPESERPSPRSMKSGVWSIIASFRFYLPIGQTIHQQTAEIEVKDGKTSGSVFGVSAEETMADLDKVTSDKSEAMSSSLPPVPELNISTEISFLT